MNIPKSKILQYLDEQPVNNPMELDVSAVTSRKQLCRGQSPPHCKIDTVGDYVLIIPYDTDSNIIQPDKPYESCGVVVGVSKKLSDVIPWGSVVVFDRSRVLMEAEHLPEQLRGYRVLLLDHRYVQYILE